MDNEWNNYVRSVRKAATEFSELKNISKARNVFHQFPSAEASSYMLSPKPNNFMLYFLYVPGIWANTFCSYKGKCQGFGCSVFHINKFPFTDVLRDLGFKLTCLTRMYNLI